MNTAKDLMKRLLHLFPLATAKEAFDKTGTADVVLDEITDSQTQAAIKSFAFENYPITRQNIYIYQLNEVFIRADFDPEQFPFTVEHSESPQEELRIHSLPRTKFDVLIGRTGDRQNLIFIQPITVRLIGDILVIHFTKLVRNISYYFAENDYPVKISQDNQESDILAKVLAFFDDYDPQPLDINAGVKHLWEIDDVDCHKVLSRKAASSVMETMDENLLFKEQYPAEYLTIIQRPLEKTVFKYLLDDGYLCNLFTTEPTVGRISINQFPEDINQAKNVVSKILANN